MANRKTANYERIDLPNGGWLLLYNDGRVKLSKYESEMRVVEVLNRSSGDSHVIIEVTRRRA